MPVPHTGKMPVPHTGKMPVPHTGKMAVPQQMNFLWGVGVGHAIAP